MSKMNLSVKKSQKELVELIEKTPQNCFMTVYFYKKDKTARKLNGLRGVKKHLHGGKTTVDVNKFFIFWDRGVKDYRAVNRNTIYKVTVNKVTYYTLDKIDLGE